MKTILHSYDPSDVLSFCFQLSTSHNTKPPWMKEFQGTILFFWWGKRSSETQLLKRSREQHPFNPLLGCWVAWVVGGKGKWEVELPYGHSLLNHFGHSWTWAQAEECSWHHKDVMVNCSAVRRQPIATTVDENAVDRWETTRTSVKPDSSFLPLVNSNALHHRQSINTQAWSAWRFYQTEYLCEFLF